MLRTRDERGAALLMVIGVIAALAVLAGALVMLTANAQSNTAHDRNRAKAFNVAEAAVDAALAKIGRDWPYPPRTAEFTSAEIDTLEARFPGSEFDNPTIEIAYFDNNDTNLDGHFSLADGVPQDANRDGLIYIEAQARVGDKKARIQLEAMRNAWSAGPPRGVAAITDGNIEGNNNKHSVGSTPPDGYMAPDQISAGLQVYAGGTIYGDSPDPAVVPPSNQHSNQIPIPYDPSVLDALYPPENLQGLIDAAKAQGTWYSDIQSEIDLGAKNLNTQFTDASLVGAPVVVETTDALKVEWNTLLNGDGELGNPAPGFLVVIGPQTMYPDDATKVGVSQGFNVAGNGKYFGAIYTDGSLWGTGTINIVGMVMARAGINLTGERRIDYNDHVVANLNNAITISAQIVPNTWRQIAPH